MEDELTRFEKVKQHMKENKKVYLVGAGCLTAGYLLRGKTSPDVVQLVNNSTDNVAAVVNRSKNVKLVVKYLNQRNYNAKPVRCLETRQEFPSQEEACEAFNMASSILSQHLNGKFENAKGLHFERIKPVV